MIGGLIGGHVSALYLKEKYKRVNYLNWYKNELLHKAKELGYKLLPAFNTKSGLPLSRINLKYGITNTLKNSEREKFTCTSCAGTLLLEFSALSRLTGDPIFEEKARKALDYIWDKRNRVSDLVGTILSVQNGDWINKDATIGAGIDSYYEYLLKGYILLGDEKFLQRFNRHYESIMKHMSQQQGFLMQTVHMHMPYKQARSYMDALLAFWPGLQVLKGDIKEAIKMHELLYQIVKKHKFLPEAFLSDHSVHWGNHPLRPEFLESTYYLYHATKDNYYLEIGKEIINNLELYSRVQCGYAALADVKTVRQEDRMDSFVYAETFKYLYLLFEEEENLVIDMNEFILTTEVRFLFLFILKFYFFLKNLKAHLIPLSLVNYKYNNKTFPILSTESKSESNEPKSCQSLKSLFKNEIFSGTQEIRDSVLKGYEKNVQYSTCGSTGNSGPINEIVDDATRLKATEFVAGKIEHADLLKTMGIKIQVMNDGRLQLVHQANEAQTTRDAQNGLLFMNEMLLLSKESNFYVKNDDYKPLSLILFKQKYFDRYVKFLAGPAQFGLDLRQNFGLFGLVEISDPIEACSGSTSSDLSEKISSIKNKDDIKNKIILARRGSCLFVDKVRNLEHLSAKSVIIFDNVEKTSFSNSPLFAMSGDGLSDVKISSVFLFSDEALRFMNILEETKKRVILYIGSNDTNLMKASFYFQLNELRDYAKYDLEFKCKKKSLFFDNFNSKNVCLKDDYELLKGFFDYFNGDFEKYVEIIRFDKSGVIKLLLNKKTGFRELKFEIEDMLIESGIDLNNIDELIKYAYNQIRYILENNSNILQLSDYKKYFEMLYNFVHIIVRNLIIENLNMSLTDENILQLINLANSLELKK
jgi:ER degradation enhancer, mannosidase alpha-like 3